MKNLLRLFFLAIFFLLIYSCNEDVLNNPVKNQPPDTGLFLYPDSTITRQPSRLHVHWWGDDPDGLIRGYYFKWVGIDSFWTFTPSNDSIFSLPIGSADTTYDFLVSAADEDGNGVYDNDIFQNGIDYGAEPFIDLNGNGIRDNNEPFYDIGLIDPTPASLLFPIKNTPPVLEWDELTVLPDTSFPVMTFKWNADDLDGVESIQEINISLNDTTNFVSLDGSIRLITIRIKDPLAPVPEMEILINGSDQNIFPELLSGLQLNSNNKIYIQAVDLSGATSNRIVLPDTSGIWYVKKPKGQVLIFDDFSGSSSDLQVRNFYRNVFSTIGGGSLTGKYDEYDLANQPLPFENVTLYETMKLFKYTFYYGVSNPRLDLLNQVTNKYLEQGGKIAFSMTFQDSSSTFDFDLSILQGFLPIDGVSNSLPFLLSGADVLPSSIQIDYPPLKTTSTIAYVRTFTPNAVVSTEIYNISSSQINGNIGLITNDKTEFFIGLPLHLCNGGNENVDNLLEKVFFEEFGLIP
jgi:hypothetical protein